MISNSFSMLSLKIFFKLIILLVLITSCSRQNETVKAIENTELKYALHHDYLSFLRYLEDSTQNLNTDLDKLIFIRQRVAELIDVGVGANDFSRINENWTEANGSEYYALFYENKATVKCGGTSFFLQNVYRDLGYTSYTLDMGCANVYTHQVTLVQSKDNQKFYVQDAFHNVSYYDKQDNHYLSFEEIVSYLKNRNDLLIKNTYNTYRYKPDFDTTGLYGIGKIMGATKEQYKKLAKQDLSVIYRESMVNPILDSLRNVCLKNNNLPEKPIYIYICCHSNITQKRS